MRTTALAATVLALAGCTVTPAAHPTPTPPPTTSASASPARAQPTARQIADRLSDLYPLPNPRDNTGSCRPAGCRQLITTDAVSVYDWKDEATAKRWAGGLGKNVRQIGPYVLSWMGSEQAFTSKEARAKMAAEVEHMSE